MPKVVDHETRRGEIADAVGRVIARAGIPGATVRAVAHESGWSVGAVRYYFASQDELLHFAVETMLRRVPERVRSVRDSTAKGPHRAAAYLEQLLPLDDERRAECTVWLAALERARHDPAMEELRVQGWRGERHLVTLVVAEARGVPTDVDLDDLPAELVDAVDDLQIRLDGATLIWTTMTDQVSPEDLRAHVRRWVADLSRP